jgi:tetratricopeptide (TPR) repeat protein
MLKFKEKKRKLIVEPISIFQQNPEDDNDDEEQDDIVDSNSKTVKKQINNSISLSEQLYNDAIDNDISKNDLDNALLKLERACKLQPNNALFSQALAQVFLEKGLYFDAIKHCDNALSCSELQKKSFPAALLTKARAQLNLGEPSLAKQTYLQFNSTTTTTMSTTSSLSYIGKIDQEDLNDAKQELATVEQLLTRIEQQKQLLSEKDMKLCREGQIIINE